MKKISDLIITGKHFIDKKICKKIYSYLYEKTNQSYKNDNAMPWFIGNNIFYNNIDDIYIKSIIKNVNYKVANLLSQHHKVKIYPHLCDLVLWKEGQFMNRHVDDGTNSKNGIHLSMRKYSAIIYLNKDFDGGETYIRIDDNNDYISKPKTGSLVAFTGDYRSAHGVNLVKKGNRGTIAMWFATEEQHCGL
jgi:predicted 2-oxoglutarate/Fe(II)-dependent dioxygenase YbiX